MATRSPADHLAVGLPVAGASSLAAALPGAVRRLGRLAWAVRTVPRLDQQSADETETLAEDASHPDQAVEICPHPPFGDSDPNPSAKTESPQRSQRRQPRPEPMHPPARTSTRNRFPFGASRNAIFCWSGPSSLERIRSCRNGFPSFSSRPGSARVVVSPPRATQAPVWEVLWHRWRSVELPSHPRS